VTRFHLLAIGFAALALAAAVVFAPSRTAPGQAAEPEAAVIGHLKMRNWNITLLAGGTYTVRTPDGTLVAENASVDRLRALDPGLAGTLEQLAAGTAFHYAGK
jgi:hypothetical protein